jgi:hypothetical protein
MPTRANDRFFEEDRGCDWRYGLEHDEKAEFVRELELADRIADQASLPPGHYAARRLARARLGLGRSPHEQPHAAVPPPPLAPGDAVTYRARWATSAPATAPSSACSTRTKVRSWCASRAGRAAPCPRRRSSEGPRDAPAQTTAGAAGGFRPPAHLPTIPPGLNVGEWRARRRRPALPPLTRPGHRAKEK